jgi:hypothetical protein
MDLKVNTIIIGAGRSGTTSLYKMMEQHPDVCFSDIKEVHYFSVPDLYKRGAAYLHSFYTRCKNEAVVAVADTYLMIDHDGIARLHDYNPEMKIIVMLRNPVDRAYSSYNYSVNYGHHDAYAKFSESIIKESLLSKESDIARRNNLGHFYAGMYHMHLQKWLEVFPRDQFLIMTTRELKASQEKVAEKLFNFLEIPVLNTNVAAANVQAVPKSKGLELFLLNRDHKLRRAIRWLTPSFVKRWIFGSGLVDKVHQSNRKQQEAEKLSTEERDIAMKYFRDDLRSLEDDFGIKDVD